MWKYRSVAETGVAEYDKLAAHSAADTLPVAELEDSVIATKLV